MYDCDAWIKYPHLHKWFNKLWLAERLGYVCGPTGVGVPKKGYYIVKPIYNLSGMGAGAEKRWLVPEHDVVIPGYFWCEYFEGTQFTYDLEWQWDGPPFWKVIRAHRCDKKNNQRFTKFTREILLTKLTPPHFFYELSDVGVINVEMIDDKIIEIHLRPNPDPDRDEVIPIFADEQQKIVAFLDQGYEWIESPDDADGLLDTARLGFLVR